MRTFLKRRVGDFNFFFCFLSNSIFLKQDFVWKKHVITSKLFYSFYRSGEAGVFLVKFFNYKKEFWDFFWEIFNLKRILTVGFFVELELIGLGFRIKKIISNVYRFFWGYATFVYLFVPINIFVEYASEGRSIFFFSNEAAAVNGFSSYLMLLKRLSNYRMIGFTKPGRIIRLNTGKQR